MVKGKLGGIRRGQVLRSNGPGSVIDFRSKKGGIVGVIPTFIDKWPAAHIKNKKNRIYDSNLQKKLNKQYFVEPPIILESFYNKKNDSQDNKNDFYRISTTRFPDWLECPKCSLIKPSNEWSNEMGEPSKYCAKCSKSAGENIYTAPVRFIVACPNGHISEFPWKLIYNDRIKHAPKCKQNKMKLVQVNTLGLAGLQLQCAEDKCGGCFSFRDIFQKDFLIRNGVRCGNYIPGCIPANHEEPCDKDPRVVQRGASNLYFPCEEVALTIPPMNDDLESKLDFSLSSWFQKEFAKFKNMVTAWADAEDVSDYGFDSKGDFIENLCKRWHYANNPELQNSKFEEYKRFCEINEKNDFETFNEEKYFSVQKQNINKIQNIFIKDKISLITKALKLRELRVLKGFTRLSPPGLGESKMQKIISNSEDIDWLPVTVVNGEGLFIEFSNNKLQLWSKQQGLHHRVGLIKSVYDEIIKEKEFDEDMIIDVNPIFVLLHTLSHLIIKELSFECGYATSALRERLYIDQKDSMSGILIYTATSDSEGTLGGLSQMAEPERIEQIIIKAIENSFFCSSDPICKTTIDNSHTDLSLASCHNCCQLPETSCEHFNQFLDRNLIHGFTDIDGNKIEGFFQKI